MAAANITSDRLLREKRVTYRRLMRRLKDRCLTKQEHQKLIALTDELECAHAELLQKKAGLVVNTSFDS